MDEPELRKLLNQAIDETIDEADFAVLQNELRHSQEARRLYYELLSVDHLLAERYEMPDYISLHAQTMNDSWVVRRFRSGKVMTSVGAAVVLLLATLSIFFFVRHTWGGDGIEFEASADSRYSIAGRVGETGELQAGQALDIERGVVSLKLTPYVEAWVEGPSRVRVLNEEGHLELEQGRAYFEVAPGGQDFEVHCSGSVIRDIGTKFGVDRRPNGFVEVHVGSGAVEITDASNALHRVESGSAIRYGRAGKPRSVALETERFIHSLPWQRVTLHDHFEATDGTRLAGWSPRVGNKWVVFDEKNPTTLRDGVLDTSHGARELSVGCRQVTETNQRRCVYLVTLTTRTPANMSDKHGAANAVERISLVTPNSGPLLSLVGNGADGHQWRIVDAEDQTGSGGSGLSALEEHTLTLAYESWSGIAKLYEGASPSGQELASKQVRSGGRVDAVAIANQDLGDLALEELSVRVVVYPQKNSRDH